MISEFKRSGGKVDVIVINNARYVNADFVNFIIDKLEDMVLSLAKLRASLEFDDAIDKVMEVKNDTIHENIEKQGD